MESICKLISFDEEKQNLWLIYELGGTPLSKLLFETKGQFYNAERIYEVTQDEVVYSILQEDNCR